MEVEAVEVVATAAAVWAVRAKVAAAGVEGEVAAKTAAEEASLDALAGVLGDTTVAEARAKEVAAKEEGKMEVAAVVGV
eukprot:349458-Prymnesium_polylepis.1